MNERRYVPNGTPLTAHERELLVVLMEECAEVIQAASKLVRFGRENRPDTGERNEVVLGMEFGDLSEVVSRLAKVRLVEWRDVAAGQIRKRDRLDHFLQTDQPT